MKILTTVLLGLVVGALAGSPSHDIGHAANTKAPKSTVIVTVTIPVIPLGPSDGNDVPEQSPKYTLSCPPDTFDSITGNYTVPAVPACLGFIECTDSVDAHPVDIPDELSHPIVDQTIELCLRKCTCIEEDSDAPGVPHTPATPSKGETHSIPDNMTTTAQSETTEGSKPNCGGNLKSPEAPVEFDVTTIQPSTTESLSEQYGTTSSLSTTAATSSVTQTVSTLATGSTASISAKVPVVPTKVYTKTIYHNITSTFTTVTRTATHQDDTSADTFIITGAPQANSVSSMDMLTSEHPVTPFGLSPMGVPAPPEVDNSTTTKKISHPIERDMAFRYHARHLYARGGCEDETSDSDAKTPPGSYGDSNTNGNSTEDSLRLQCRDPMVDLMDSLSAFLCKEMFTCTNGSVAHDPSDQRGYVESYPEWLNICPAKCECTSEPEVALPPIDASYSYTLSYNKNDGSDYRSYVAGICETYFGCFGPTGQIKSTSQWPDGSSPEFQTFFESSCVADSICISNYENFSPYEKTRRDISDSNAEACGVAPMHGSYELDCSAVETKPGIFKLCTNNMACNACGRPVVAAMDGSVDSEDKGVLMEAHCLPECVCRKFELEGRVVDPPKESSLDCKAVEGSTLWTLCPALFACDGPNITAIATPEGISKEELPALMDRYQEICDKDCACWLESPLDEEDGEYPKPRPRPSPANSTASSYETRPKYGTAAAYVNETSTMYTTATAALSTSGALTFEASPTDKQYQPSYSWLVEPRPTLEKSELTLTTEATAPTTTYQSAAAEQDEEVQMWCYFPAQSTFGIVCEVIFECKAINADLDLRDPRPDVDMPQGFDGQMCLDNCRCAPVDGGFPSANKLPEVPAETDASGHPVPTSSPEEEPCDKKGGCTVTMTTIVASP